MSRTTKYVIATLVTLAAVIGLSLSPVPAAWSGGASFLLSYTLFTWAKN